MHRRWAWVDLSRWLISEPDLSHPDGAPSPEVRAAEAQAARRLERALSALADREREVLLLSLDDGLTPAERAAILGVTEATYRQRLHRARQSLERWMVEGSTP